LDAGMTESRWDRRFVIDSLTEDRPETLFCFMQSTPAAAS